MKAMDMSLKLNTYLSMFPKTSPSMAEKHNSVLRAGIMPDSQLAYSASGSQVLLPVVELLLREDLQKHSQHSDWAMCAKVKSKTKKTLNGPEHTGLERWLAFVENATPEVPVRNCVLSQKHKKIDANCSLVAC